MVKLGKIQEFEIIRKKDLGIYLAEKEGDEATVLLLKRQVPEGTGTEDKVEVLIYEDSSDHLIATTGKPKLQMGETAELEVKDVIKIGVFPDMGLKKDLLLPFKKQAHPVKREEQRLVIPYVDKSRRLVATMCVYSHMNNQFPYKVEDWAADIVYETNETIGAFVMVDHKYRKLTPKKKLYGRFREGDTVQAGTTRAREDGKLDLCAREKSYAQMGIDAEEVLKVMDQFDGVPPFNGKAGPEVTMRGFNMSKNAFKRTVGRLLREGKIRITDRTIERV